MKAERMRILEMLEQQKITAAQANELLSALETSAPGDRRSADETPHTPQPLRLSGGAGWAAFGQSVAQQVRNALAGLPGHAPGEQGPQRENFGAATVTNDVLSRMEDGTSYTNFGELTIADDVEQDLLDRKIGKVTNFGEVTGPAELLSMLEARCETNFGEFAGEGARAGAEHEFSNLGKSVLTEEQLRRMPDGATYSNLGKLTIAENVSEELLAEKIAVFKNLGNTEAPAHLLAVLQARCPENLGNFKPSDSPENQDE